MKVIVGLLIVTAPAWMPRLTARKKAGPISSPTSEEPEDDEDEDVRELRDSLISVLQKLQKAERQVEVLTDSLQLERAQTRTLTTELAEVRGEVARLQGLFEMLIQHRSMPPPTGL